MRKILALAAIAFAVACGSGDVVAPVDQSPPPALGAGVVSAALTGFGDSAKSVSWTNVSATKDSTGLYFQTGDARLSVRIKGASVPGTYSLGGRDSFVEYLLVPNRPEFLFSTFGNTGTTGSVQLVSLTAHRATGTFFFSTPAKNDGSTETGAFAISGGTFDVAFP